MSASIQKSTIVRIFHALERLAPALGARWAEQLWFSVPGGRQVRRAAPPPDRRFTAGDVAAESWGDGPIVYLMHGWGGQRTDLDALVAPLVASGHRVVSFDAPSHGESAPGPSGPHRSTILEFAAALRAVVAAEGPAHAIIAHSLGCIGATFALADGLRTERLAFFAPMGAASEYTHEFARRLGFGERIRTRLVARIERRFGQPMSHFSVAARIRDIASPPPLLIVHDQDDAETPWAGSAALAEIWPDPSLLTTSGLGHRRVLRDAAAVAEAVSFVAAPALTPDRAPKGH